MLILSCLLHHFEGPTSCTCAIAAVVITAATFVFRLALFLVHVSPLADDTLSGCKRLQWVVSDEFST